MRFTHFMRLLSLYVFFVTSAAFSIDNYYEILGASRDSDAAAIDRAYAAKLLQFPSGLPDRVRYAYLTLSEPTRKAPYDIKLAEFKRLQAARGTVEKVRAAIGFVPGVQLVDAIVDDALAADQKKSRAYFTQLMDEYHDVLAELMTRDAKAKAKIMSYGGPQSFVASLFSDEARCRWIMYRGMRAKARALDEPFQEENRWELEFGVWVHQLK